MGANNGTLFRDRSAERRVRAPRCTRDRAQRLCRELLGSSSIRWDAKDQTARDAELRHAVDNALGSLRPLGLRCERYLRMAVRHWLGWRTNTRTSALRYLAIIVRAVRVGGLRSLDAHCGIGSAWIGGYVRHMQAAGYQPRTINWHLAGLSSWYGWLQEHGQIQRSPVHAREHRVRVDHSRLYHPARIGHVRRSLSPDHALAFVAWAFSTATPAVRCLAMMLMLGAGLRRGEIIALQITDRYREGDDHCLTVLGKGGRTRSLILEPLVVAAFERFDTDGHGPGRPRVRGQLLVYPNGKPVAYTVMGDWVRIGGVVIGRPDLTPHELRRTYATRLRDAGAPLEGAQRQLGHSSADLTARFYDTGDRRLRFTTGLLPPKRTA